MEIAYSSQKLASAVLLANDGRLSYNSVHETQKRTCDGQSDELSPDGRHRALCTRARLEPDDPGPARLPSARLERRRRDRDHPVRPGDVFLYLAPHEARRSGRGPHDIPPGRRRAARHLRPHGDRTPRRRALQGAELPQRRLVLDRMGRGARDALQGASGRTGTRAVEVGARGKPPHVAAESPRRGRTTGRHSRNGCAAHSQRRRNRSPRSPTTRRTARACSTRRWSWTFPFPKNSRSSPSATTGRSARTSPCRFPPSTRTWSAADTKRPPFSTG